MKRSLSAQEAFERFGYLVWSNGAKGSILRPGDIVITRDVLGSILPGGIRLVVVGDLSLSEAREFVFRCGYMWFPPPESDGPFYKVVAE